MRNIEELEKELVEITNQIHVLSEHDKKNGTSIYSRMINEMLKRKRNIEININQYKQRGDKDDR